VLSPGDYDQGYLEKIKAAKFEPSLSIDSIRYESHQPPLYYLLAAPAYLAARPFGLLTSLYVLRLLSVLLGASVLWLSYRLLSGLFPDDGLIVLASVGLMAAVPMHIAISASANNDILSELVLWHSVDRLAARGAEAGRPKFLLWGGLAYAAALLTKTTIYLPGAALLVGAEALHMSPLSQLRVAAPRGEAWRTIQWGPSFKSLTASLAWRSSSPCPGLRATR